jgi:transcriptional regulator with GAF, ATPase, and Fis domain
MWLTISLENDKNYEPVSFLLKEGFLVVGRGKNAELSLPDRAISGRHLDLEVRGGLVSFNDLNSRHGTLYNGKKCNSSKIVEGDVLTLGKFSLTFTKEVFLSSEPSCVSGLTIFPSSEEVLSGSALVKQIATISSRLQSETKPRTLMSTLLEALVGLFKAQRGFILLKDGASERLVTVASHLINDTDDFVSLSSTVYMEAMKKKGTVIVANSSSVEDNLYALSVQLYPGPKSIICSPLISSNEVYGVIYLDMPAREDNTLPDWVKESLETILSLASEKLAGQKVRYRLVAARERVVALQAVSFASNQMVLGDGPDARHLRMAIKQAASSDASVLITGETGTGKEVVAQALHAASKRKNGPFIAVNCSAIPSELIEAELFGAEKGAYTGSDKRRIGRFELAAGGTLFLDETGELPLSVQVKLLRVLEERKMCRLGGNEDIILDFRLVCATNRDLLRAVDEGIFRADLYYRLNVFHIPLKPLRERSDEILPLAAMFLNTFARKYGKKLSGFSTDAKRSLLDNNWPGNVRELRNAVERAVIIEAGEEISLLSLPLCNPVPSTNSGISEPDDFLHANYNDAKDAFDKSFLEKSLLANDGNIAAVVRETGIGRPTIYRWMKKFSFTGEDDN